MQVCFWIGDVVLFLYWDKNHCHWMNVSTGNNTFYLKVYLTCMRDTFNCDLRVQIHLSGLAVLEFFEEDSPNSGFDKYWNGSGGHILQSQFVMLFKMPPKHSTFLTQMGFYKEMCFFFFVVLLHCTWHTFVLPVQRSNLQIQLWWACLRLQCLLSSRRTYFRCVCQLSSQANAD